MTYTCKGSVRGTCGRTHKTIDEAVRHISQDQAGCRSQGGYSDRDVVRTDGQPLTADEREDADVAMSRAQGGE